MEQLWPYIAVVIVLALVFFAGGKGAEVTQSAFEGYFRGFRTDPWPHGVQEEDFDHHWGSRPGEPLVAGQRTDRQSGRRTVHETSSALGAVGAEIAELTTAEASAVATRPVRGYRVHSH